MSEWLTTGQMIDRLKVGEVSYNMDGHYVKKNENGSLVYCDKNGIPRSNFGSSVVFLNGFFLSAKWRILPKYVTFEEAMKALKDGKKVRFHVRDRDVIWWDIDLYEERLFEWFKDECLTYKDLLEGKWQIIE